MKLRKLFVALSALALSFGASVAAMTTINKGNSESVDAATNQTIRVFLNLPFGDNQSGTINNGNWTSGTSTTLNNCNYYWETTSATAGSTNNTFNLYFRQNNYTYWHPYSGSQTWDTNYSTISTSLKAGHSYTITGIGYEYGYGDGKHKWFHFTVTDLGSIATTTTVYFDPGASYASYTTPYCYYADVDGIAPTAWHGTAMTKVNNNKSIYGGYRWSATVTNNASVVIFNNNASAQTDDLTVNSGKTYLLGTGWVTNLTLTTTVSSTTTTYHIYSGVNFKLPTLPAAPTGYTAEWNTAADGSGTTYSGTISRTSSLTLYAYNRPIVYHIRYDRNLNDDTHAIQDKQYDVPVNTYTPGTSPLNGDGWNPSPYKYFKEWNTNYLGNGVTYLPGSSITVNASFYLYYIEKWFDYRYKVDNGSYVYLTNNSDYSGVLQQFAPASKQSLPSGGMLTFEVNAYDGHGWTVIPSNKLNYPSGSNYDTTHGIGLTTIDTIFLKLKSDGNYDVWVPGQTEYTLRVNKSSDDIYSMVGWGTSGGGKEQMKATAFVYGQKGQILEIGYQGGYYRGYRNNSCVGIEEKTVSGNTNLYFTITGMYNIYLIKEDGAHWDNIYVEIDNNESAAKWASVFMSTVGCDASGIDEPSGWASCISYYANLSDGTKNLIYAALANVGGSILEQAVARYDYAVAHHSNLTRFIVNSSSTPRSVSIASQSFVSLKAINNNSFIVIILVSSSIVVAGVGGFFLLRKRKEQ